MNQNETHEVEIEANMDSPADSNSRHTADENSADAETADLPQSTAEKSSESSAEIEKLTLELSEQKERLLRNVAEMDNMRKRMEREKQDFMKFANENLLKDMIPVLDSMEKAIPSDVSPDSSIASYRDGIHMVQKQLLQALSKHGLEPIESVNKPFDPNLHQAIQRVESNDIQTDTVLAEFAKGYLLHGRLVRPSMVSVKVPQ